jgi:hypothetical protein
MVASDVIAIAKVSQYLWNDQIAERGFFNNIIDPYKARQLYMERKALQYAVDNNLTSDGLTNYVYALCGQNVQAAQNTGGIVIMGGGNYGVLEYSNFATPGATSISFNVGVVNPKLLYASRGGIDVGAILTTGTPVGNQVLWDSATATLTVAADVPFSMYGENEFVRILVK